MGRKRKHNGDEEIKREIQRLQRKIRTKRRRIISSESSSEEENDDTNDGRAPAPPGPSRIASPPHAASPPRGAASPHGASPPSSGAAEAIALVNAPPSPSPPVEPELDEEILQLLGDAPKVDSSLGPPVHKDIANRWQEILAKGLSKDVKDKLLQEYAVPGNCDLLLAPTLNPEAKAALTETMVKRDTSLMYKQKQLGTALAALSTAMELLIANETSKQKILKPLSDACRLLCDSHHTETKTRRTFVISSVNTSLKDTLVETERDRSLFGENVNEKLKAAKTIQRSEEALKISQRQTFTKSNFAIKNKNRLNFRPFRRNEDRPFRVNAERAARAPPPPPPPARQTRSSARKPPARDRSPLHTRSATLRR